MYFSIRQGPRQVSALLAAFVMAFGTATAASLATATPAKAEMSCVHWDTHRHDYYSNGLWYRYIYNYKGHRDTGSGHWHDYWFERYRPYDGHNWWGREAYWTGRYC